MAIQTPNQLLDHDDIPEPDLPPEFNTDTPPVNSTGMSTADLNELGFDDQRDQETYKTLHAPTGDWDKGEHWEYNKVVLQQDKQPGDIDPVGRTLLIFSGRCQPRTRDGQEYCPLFFLRISPDKRYKKDASGNVTKEVDMAHKLFVKAKEDLFLSIKGETPKKFAQLIDMLQEDNYTIRSMNGDNGPVVVDIKITRKR